MTDSTSTERRRTGRGRRLGAVLVLLLAMLVTGAVAYNMGISHAVAQAALTPGPQGAIPPYYLYGSGLGLTIARSLARAHGGELTATSQPGTGTTLTLRLWAPSAPAPLPSCAHRQAAD